MTVEELIEQLKEHEDLNASIACMIWTIDDVFHLPDFYDIDEEITTEIAEEVIEYLSNNNDADEGMSWDSLFYAYESIIEARSLDRT